MIQTQQTLKAIGIIETKAKRILNELEKNQSDHLQQKLIPDRSIVKECLVSAEKDNS